MMKATGSESALELSLDGKPLVMLNHAKLGFSIDGQAYTVRRSGFLGPLYELQRDGLTLLSAKQAALTNRYTVSLGDRAWVLKAVEITNTRFGLFDGATQVGGISPASRIRYTSDITIDLPEVLPLAGQVFLMGCCSGNGVRRRVEPGFAKGSTHPAALLPDRYPNLEPAIAGRRIEGLVITLEVRRVSGLHPRHRQPVIPDRVDGAADGRDVLGVGEHRIFLLGIRTRLNSRGRSEKSVTSTPAM